MKTKLKTFFFFTFFIKANRFLVLLKTFYKSDRKKINIQKFNINFCFYEILSLNSGARDKFLENSGSLEKNKYNLQNTRNNPKKSNFDL